MAMWLGIICIAGPCFLSVELHVYTPFNLLKSGDCQGTLGTLHEPLGMQNIMVVGTIQCMKCTVIFEHSKCNL